MLIPELDKKLSPQAGRIVDVLAGLAIAVAAIETFLKAPLAIAIIWFQAAFLFDGKYSGTLTIVVLSAVYLIPAYSFGFAWDYATGQGKFARGEAAAADAVDSPA